MKKRLILIFTLLVLCGLLQPQPASADSILSVSAPSSVSLGQTFAVTVDITGAADLYAYQFDFAFDPSILSVSNLSEGSFLQNAGATLFVPGSIDNVAGTVSNTADTLQTAISGANGSGILVTFDFTAIGTGSSAVTLSNLFLLDSNLSSLTGTTQGGSISVGGNTTVPEPSSVALLLIGLLAVLVNMSGLHRVFIGRFL